MLNSFVYEYDKGADVDGKIDLIIDTVLLRLKPTDNPAQEELLEPELSKYKDIKVTYPEESKTELSKPQEESKEETAEQFCSRIDNEEGESWSNDYTGLIEKLEEYANQKTASLKKENEELRDTIKNLRADKRKIGVICDDIIKRVNNL